MVYVVNADECEVKGANLAGIRNRLFTAITRSKAWVRVTGVGAKMEAIAEEYNQIKNADFKLTFKYPTEEELKQMRIIHRDMSVENQRTLEKYDNTISDMIRDLNDGVVFVDDFDAEQIEALRTILDRRA